MAGGSFWGRLSGWLRGRAANDRNSVTITVVPSRAGRAHQVELPRAVARFLVGTLGAMLVVVLLVGVGSAFLIGEIVKQNEIRQENRRLREQIARLEVLEEEVRALDRTRRQIYDLAGVEREDDRAEEHRPTDPLQIDGPGEAGWIAGGVLSDAAQETPLRCLPFRGPVSRGYSLGAERGPAHGGVDIAGQEGSPILAAAAGVVTFAGEDATFGNLLVLRHQEGWETRYGHNQTLLVAEGDTVTAGQKVARVGNTGQSSAPHLHFETLRQGAAVDPSKYFRPYRSASSDGRSEAP